MVLVNPTPTTISMDLVDLTIVAERLNTRCISAYGSQGTYYGSAGFQGIEDFAPPSILFVVPFLFYSWMKPNQLSPLVSFAIVLLKGELRHEGD